MKPTFGTLNATLAKIIIANAPKYTKITEPFGDGGSLALEMAKRKPKTHTVNIADEMRYSAFLTVQRLSGSDKKQLKGFDWVASQETFDSVLAITATEGPQLLYRFLYLKKFGMKMDPDPEAPPGYDILSTGRDASGVLMGLPMMKVALKGVTITNDDPMRHVAAGGGAFLILLPKMPEHVEAVQAKLGSLGGEFFFAAKVADGLAVVETAKKFSQFNVMGQKAASIMMGTMAIITNYESKLEPIDADEMEM